jgi:hypothetical protein
MNGSQRVAMKKRLVEVALAQHRVDALEHVAGVTACANADALAAQAVLLVNRQALTNATAALASASSSASTGKKPFELRIDRKKALPFWTSTTANPVLRRQGHVA